MYYLFHLRTYDGMFFPCCDILLTIQSLIEAYVANAVMMTPSSVTMLSSMPSPGIPLNLSLLLDNHTNV